MCVWNVGTRIPPSAPLMGGSGRGESKLDPCSKGHPQIQCQYYEGAQNKEEFGVQHPRLSVAPEASRDVGRG